MYAPRCPGGGRSGIGHQQLEIGHCLALKQPVGGNLFANQWPIINVQSPMAEMIFIRKEE